MILAISRTIFELQRRTIPHFNPLKKSFWSFEMHFHPRSYRFSDILQNMCPIVFAPDFSTFLCVREGKKTFPRVLRIHKNEKKILEKNLGFTGIWTRIDGTKVSYACLPTTEKQYWKIYNSWKTLIMKFTGKKGNFQKNSGKIADQLFWNSIFEFFFITKYQKNLIQAWETPKLELSLSFQPLSCVPLQMVTINVQGGVVISAPHVD